MAFWHRFIRGLRDLVGSRRVEADLDEELQSYLTLAEDDARRAGRGADEAHRSVRVALGSSAAIKDETREAGWESRLVDVWRDLRYGWRLLRRAPGFTAVAILTLAIGIGANTAIFSIVDAALLRALPYPDAEALVTIHESKPNFASGSISFPNFKDWRDGTTTFASMAISRGTQMTLTGGGTPERVDVQFITADFLRVLGLTPVAGRWFQPGEDEVGGAPMALLSDGLWRRRFGAAHDILGRTLTLDGTSFVVIGVAPTVDTRFAAFAPPDVYLPLGQWTNPLLRNRASGLGLHGIGRLKPGVTIAQARADLARVTTALANTFPEEDTGVGATLRSFTEDVTRSARQYLWPLLGAVACVLLIACVNIGSLLTARAASRAHEYALRTSLGAGRGRLIRQQLTESVLLGALGGGLGLALAVWLTHAALSLLPASVPGASHAGLNTHTLIFTLAVSILSGLAFGLVPAIRMSAARAQTALKIAGRQLGASRLRVTGGLIVVELALAFVLLTAAGLMVRTLNALWRVDTGFTATNVVTFGVSLSPSTGTAGADSIRTAFRRIGESIGAVPGVRATSFSWGATPMAGDDEDLFWIEGDPKPASTNDMKWALSYVVDPGYRDVLGLSVRRGRFLTTLDDEHHPHVVVVDDVFAEQYLHGANPIGRRLVLPSKGGVATVIGVVNHVNQWGLTSDATESLRAQLYMPFLQLPDEAMVLSWRGTGGVLRLDPRAPASSVALGDAVRRSGADDTLFGVQSLEEIIATSPDLAGRQFVRTLLTAFALVGLVLAAIGTYGVTSYAVSTRTAEWGVRLALGARRGTLLLAIVGSGLRLAGLGLLVGAIAAVALTRLLRAQLFGVSTTDPTTFAAVALILLAVAAGACLLPARRAMRLDPAAILRS